MKKCLFSRTMKKVCIIGSGKWGSAVAKLVGNNVLRTDLFGNEVKMYVFEEFIDGKKLTEIINSEHLNPKYLPGVKLPENIVAVPCIKETAENADVIIFILRQQYLAKACEQLKGFIKSSAVGISLTKSLYHSNHDEDGADLKCASDVIKEKLEMKVSVLMGPNLAEEIAKEKFSETTIASTDKELIDMWRKLFQCSYFNVKFCKYITVVELCGALKNVVAAAAGLCDGLNCGKNSKAAIIRLGFLEMKRFIIQFTGESDDQVYWEPCGFPDLIATCYGGMTRKVIEDFVKSGKTLRQAEIDLFNGNILEGPLNVKQVYLYLKKKGTTEMYPLLRAVYGLFHEDKPVRSFMETLKASF